MKLHRAPRSWDAAAMLAFGSAGFFASLAAANPPDWISRTWLSFLQHYWPIAPGIAVVALFLVGMRFQTRVHSPAFSPTALEERYADYVYRYYGVSAASLRLVGADDEWFPPAHVTTAAAPEPYELPDDFLADKTAVVERLRADAVKNGRMFFDGPATRLLSYTAMPVDATEDKHLHLNFGRIGWFDFSVAKWHIDAIVHAKDFLRLAEFVDLDAIAASGTLSATSLTNIACTATTFITADGYVTFSRRSGRVSSQGGKFTSAVAENIHFEKDGVASATQHGLPVPFRAVIRGVEEELSPLVAAKLQKSPERLYFLGIDFDLESFQPDLLFLVAWPENLSALREDIARKPGRDFVEGSLQAVPFDRQHIEYALAQAGWVPGGKASVMRSIEFVTSSRVRRALTIGGKIAMLSSGLAVAAPN